MREVAPPPAPSTPTLRALRELIANAARDHGYASARAGAVPKDPSEHWSRFRLLLAQLWQRAEEAEAEALRWKRIAQTAGVRLRTVAGASVDPETEAARSA